MMDGVQKAAEKHRGQPSPLRGIPHTEERKQQQRALAVELGSREPFMRVRGGNGTGMSRVELLMRSILPESFQYNYIVKTLQKRGSGYPYHYKLDFADPLQMICLEVDGYSHNTIQRQEQDRKKEALLQDLGWSVLRVSNKDVLAMFGIWK
jgi:hypothetical protein